MPKNFSVFFFSDVSYFGGQVMRDKNYWIDNLDMKKHPEGGYYSITYECPHKISDAELCNDFKGTRSLATSIYFLIHDEDVSNFHRLPSVA